MKIHANTRPFSVSRSWFAAAGLLASLSLVPAYGANVYLGTSGDWAVGSNWVGGSVPPSADTAVIVNGLEATIGLPGTSPYTTTVTGGTVGTDQTDGTLNINTGATFNTSTGHITLGNKGSGTLNVNGGIVTVGTGGTRDIWIGQNNADTDRSSGTVNLYSGSIAARTVMLGRGNNVNYKNSEGYLNIYGGSFTAQALTAGNTVQNTYGEILISGSTATININGNSGVVFDNSKITYVIDAGGVSTISTTGDITLAGALVIDILNGVDVLPESILLLETTGTNKTITGTFDGYLSGETYTWGDITGTYVIDGTQVRIDNLALIPEPASTALMVGGLAALLVFLQRRRRR